jgi:rhodanese-related sulfurtransferase
MPASKNNSFRVFPWLAILFCILVITAWFFRFDLIKTYLGSQFPHVRTLQSGELDSWLVYTNRRQPLILDARNEKEYIFSHIPNARSAATRETLNQSCAGVEKNYPIVTYSSLGFKAYRLAHELQKEGYSNVYALDGSIFQWVQEGRALMSGENRVAIIDTGSTIWGLLLHPRYRSRTISSS